MPQTLESAGLDFYFESQKRYYLEKLAKYLNFQLSSGILFALAFFKLIALPIVVIAALIFTPFMLYIFIRERRTAWLISFIIVVIIPGSLLMYFGLKTNYPAAFGLISLGILYLYFFVMRVVVNDELKELTAGEELQKRKLEEEKEKELWMTRFNEKDRS